MPTENSITFQATGGHKHDGVGSTLIDSTKYSIFDFSTGTIGASSRVARQNQNKINLENWIVNTISSKILQPAGLRLEPNTLHGKSVIANTITADQIAANTITANELTSNIVFVNNSIQSNNYSSANATGWKISNTGSAEFNDITARGTINANSGTIARFTITANNMISSDATNPDYNIALYGNGRLYLTTIDSTFDNPYSNINGQNRQVQMFGNGIRILNNRALVDANYSSFYTIYDSGQIDFYNGGAYYAFIKADPDNYDITMQSGSSVKANSNGVYLSGKTYITGNTEITGRFYSSGTIDTDGGVWAYGSITASTGQITAGDKIYGTRFECDSNQVPIRSPYTNNGGVGFATTSSSTTARISTSDSGDYWMELKAPTSLRELKENIRDIENAVDILKQVRPRIFNWKIDAFNEVNPSTGEPWEPHVIEFNKLNTTYGFIAEEIGEDRPDLAVYSHKNPEIAPDQPGGFYDLSSWQPIMWKEMDFIPLLVKSIQEISNKLDSIESRLKALEEVE